MNQPVILRRPETAFTARDFIQMVEAGAFADLRAELVEGVIEKMTPAYLDHGRSHSGLIIQLSEAYSGTRYQLAADLIIRIDEATVRAIDIAVTIPELPGNRAATGAELILAVEIADTTLARDLGEKRADYARAEVPAYWVVDVRGRVVHAMSEPVGADYAKSELVRFGESLRPPAGVAEIVFG